MPPNIGSQPSVGRTQRRRGGRMNETLIFSFFMAFSRFEYALGLSL
jgi:hypothetical protein